MVKSSLEFLFYKWGEWRKFIPAADVGFVINIINIIIIIIIIIIS